MYVGSTGPLGLEAMVYEVLENAVDLVLSDRASEIEVIGHRDRSIEVRDNGPGLDLDDDVVRSFFTVGHDEATADGHRPHVHLWDAGLGLFVVNALTDRMIVDSQHQGAHTVYEWTSGGDNHRLLESNSTTADAESWTRIRFWPDPKIFGSSTLMPGRLSSRLIELQRLIPELETLRFTYESPSIDDGIDALMTERFRLHDGERWRYATSIPGPDGEEIEVDLGLSTIHAGARSSHRMPEQTLLFCNYREVTHESGLHRAIRSALGAPQSDPLNGLAVVCNLRMLSPQFSGPTRGRVDDPVAMNAVSTAIAELLAKHPEAKTVIAELTETGAIGSAISPG